jgi:mannitol/fructose-specific phosphotransferase system IIA component (Ntr-type)
MGTPKEKDLTLYLKILAHLSRLLEKKSFRNLLLNATSQKEIVELFRKVEN